MNGQGPHNGHIRRGPVEPIKRFRTRNEPPVVQVLGQHQLGLNLALHRAIKGVHGQVKIGIAVVHGRHQFMDFDFQFPRDKVPK